MNNSDEWISNGNDAAKPAESALGGSEDSSADKLATSQKREPRMKLSSLGDIFAERNAETRVKKLLSDVATLRAWQSEAHPSHKVRDAMAKLGSEWNVPQKAAGKKRAPRDIAADLEHELLAFAQRLLLKTNPFSSTGSVAKPSSDKTLLGSSTRRRTYSEISTDLAMINRDEWNSNL